MTSGSQVLSFALPRHLNPEPRILNPNTMDTIRHHLLSGPFAQVFKGNFDAALLTLRYDIALVGILIGLVYLLYGWRAFRVLLTIHLAAGGFALGFALGGVIFLAITTGLILAAAGAYVAWKHPRPTAAIFMGLYAALATLGLLFAHRWFRGDWVTAIQIAVSLGAGTGISLLVYYAYRVLVTALTSLHGAAGLLGGWAAILLLYPRTHSFAIQWLRSEPLLLPVGTLILAALGCIYQWHYSGKASSSGASSYAKPASEARPSSHKRLAA